MISDKNNSLTIQSIPHAFKVVEIVVCNNSISQVVAAPVYHGAERGGSNETLNLPGSLIVDDTTKKQHCPPIKIGEKINAVAGTVIGDGRTVQKKDKCDKTEIQSSTGQTGLKGEKGDTGFGSVGQKGQKGQKGEDGQDGATGDTGGTGSTGGAGQKGQKGETGSSGAQGAAGDNIDWNSTQQSIYIGSIRFGPRLIGVCKDGEYKYIYVFASDPQS